MLPSMLLRKSGSGVVVDGVLPLGCGVEEELVIDPVLRMLEEEWEEVEEGEEGELEDEEKVVVDDGKAWLDDAAELVSLSWTTPGLEAAAVVADCDVVSCETLC
jgi:hypothetical protein